MDNGNLHGLCLSFYHSRHGQIGSRRFRVLVPLLHESGIQLDVITSYSNENPAEPGIIPAKSYSPVITLTNSLWKIKNGIIKPNSPDLNRAGVSTEYDSEPLDERSTADYGIRSLVNSFNAAPDLNTGWVIPAIRAALKQKKRYDFVISTAPPWSAHMAAWRIGRRLGIPVILDDRDPWIDNSLRMNYITHPWIRRMDKYLAYKTYSKASGIVCMTDDACASYGERFKDSAVEITCLPNGYDPSLEKLYRAAQKSDKMRIIHVGSAYHGRSPRLILEAAGFLPPDIARDFHFHFVGPISESEVNSCREISPESAISFHGARDHQFCADAITDSDICLLMAIGQPRQVPAKLYEYIGLGRPVISISEKDDATMKILQGREWAWTVVNGDTRSLVETLAEIHDKWQRNALPGLEPGPEKNEFSFKTIAGKYADFIIRMIGRG